MTSKVFKTLLQYNMLSQGDTLGVGLSGGADSVALLYFFATNKDALGISHLKAIHIHHGIRGDEADRDALFARDFCLKFNIPYFEEKINIPQLAQEKKLSLETCARQERYKLLNVYAEKYNAKIAVFCCNLPHYRAFAFIAIATATKQAIEPPFTMCF